MSLRCIPIALSTVALFAAGGCKKKADEAGGDEPAPTESADAAAAKPDTPAPTADKGGDNPFGVDLAPIASKLEGTWVVGGSSLGQKAAWKVEGNKVTVFEGGKEKSAELVIVAPCRLKVVEKSGGGTTSTSTNFAFDGDKLWLGLGSSGVKMGDKVFACVSSDVYVLSGDKCQKWKLAMFDKWEQSEAECAIGDDGKLTAGGTTLEPAGEAFLNQQMKGNEAKKMDDYEAAKAAVSK